MTKKNKIKAVLMDCSKCNSMIKNNDELHCSLRMKTSDVFTQVSVVSVQECEWYRNKV